MKMKKIILTGILVPMIGGILAACGGNAGVAEKNESAAATLSAMIVQQTLAAYTAIVETQQNPATSTPFPSTTPIPTEAPPTNEPTATITPTPTQAAEDPAALLGDPAWQDSFDTQTNWTPYNDGSISKMEIKDGQMLYTMMQTTGYDYWTISYPKIRDFYLEVEATTPENCGAGDFYGIMFRAPDYSTGYIISFSCGGQYRLTYWNGSAYEYIINWASHEAILPGGNATNRIGVRVDDDRIDLYANGTKINGFVDDRSGSGYIGLSIGANDTENFVVSFDNMQYWLLP